MNKTNAPKIRGEKQQKIERRARTEMRVRGVVGAGVSYGRRDAHVPLSQRNKWKLSKFVALGKY